MSIDIHAVILNHNITYKEDKNVDEQSVVNLYADAGWIAYTKDPEKLINSIKNSLYVITAWHGNMLVGLLRIVGDGLAIVYIQDVLVLKAYKRKKIGSTLFRRTLEKYKTVRQKVLLTEDTEETRGFYEALGFDSCDKGETVAFMRLES